MPRTQALPSAPTANRPKKRVVTREYRLERLNRAYAEDPAFSPLRYQNRMMPGTGSPEPRIAFLVESPTKNDAQAGKFLSGPESMVMTDILKCMDVPVEQTYFTSLVKYPTPNGRVGKPEEMFASAPYLREETEILLPRVVVVFGRHLTEWMFPGFSLVHDHGWMVEGKKTSYVPMFHPEAALRNPDIRRAMFNAMSRVAMIA